MYLEKKRVVSCNNIVKEVNSKINTFTLSKHKIKPFGSVEDVDLSIRQKKAQLIKDLHKAITTTLAIDFDKAKQEKVLTNIRTNLPIIREIVLKLRDIDYFIETCIFKKRPIRRSVKKLSKKRYNVWSGEKKKLKICEIEFMQKLMNVEPAKKVIIQTKIKEAKKPKSQKRLIKKQTAILCSLEAKLPPPSAVKPILLKGDNFTAWASTTLSLLAALETTSDQEDINEKRPIKVIIKEKAEQLSLKESEYLIKEKPGKKKKAWKKAVIEWLAAKRL